MTYMTSVSPNNVGMLTSKKEVVITICIIHISFIDRKLFDDAKVILDSRFWSEIRESFTPNCFEDVIGGYKYGY